MNKNAKKWIKSLKSGKFKQCDGILKYEDSYCVLGVGELLYRKSVNRELRDGGYYLSSGARDWLGLKTNSGRFNGLTLADLNDNGWSFKKLANFIVKNASKLFKGDE